MIAKQIGKGLSVSLLLLGISCVSAFAGSAMVGSVAGSMNATVSGRTLIPNAVVFSGDNLKVADGVTVIALSDGSRLMFGRDTQASFLRDGDQVTVQLERGSVSVYHSGAKSGVRIQVNNVFIEPAQGFTTMGQVAALNGAVAVTSNQGVLHVRGDSSTVDVVQGKTITIRRTGRAPQAAGGAQKFAGGGSTLLEAGALGAGVVAAILAGIALSRAGDARDNAATAASEASAAAAAASSAGAAAAAADSDAILATTTANDAGCAINNFAVENGFVVVPSPYTPPAGMACPPLGSA